MKTLVANNMNIHQIETTNTISSIPEKLLNHLLELMTSIIPIAYIFRCGPKTSGIRLIIVLDQYRYQSGDETKNILEFLALSRANIEMMYYSYGAINDILQRGNLFFATYCSRDYCLYQYTSDYELFETSDTKICDLKAAAALIMKNGLAQARNFLDGSTAYFNLGRFRLSAFMLHQACEQMLRLIIKLSKGKEFKSHQLVLLQKNAGFYYPQIKNIFDVKESKELKWLELLQQAYIGARYDDHYKIEPELLIFIKGKISLMLDQLNLENLLADEKIKENNSNYLSSFDNK